MLQLNFPLIHEEVEENAKRREERGRGTERWYPIEVRRIEFLFLPCTYKKDKGSIKNHKVPSYIPD